MFGIYIGYSILATPARLYAMHRPGTFFVLYWVTEIIYSTLGLLAIYEVFGPATGSRNPRRLSCLSLGIIAGGSILSVLYHPFGQSSMALLAAAAYAFVPGALLLEAIIFLLCMRLAFRKSYPIRWGRHRLGILFGFGLAASATLMVFLARLRLGPQLEFVFRYSPPVAYISAAAVWVVALWKDEPPSEKAKHDPELWRRAAQSLTKAADQAERDWRKLRLGTVER